MSAFVPVAAREKVRGDPLDTFEQLKANVLVLTTGCVVGHEGDGMRISDDGAAQDADPFPIARVNGC